MKTNAETKVRRPRRTKADIEAAIHKAAVAQIKRDGFAGALVTDIVKRARIEPIVFYNRFKNLDEFFDTFVKRYDYWLSDLAHNNHIDLATPDGYARAMQALLDAMLGDEIMTELMRWEIADGNAITDRTAKVREVDFNSTIERCTEIPFSNDDDATTIGILVMAGIFFMILHKDRSTFAGIDLNTSEGQHRLHKAFSRLATMLYRHDSTEIPAARIGECLRDEGLSDEAIARCLARLAAERGQED